MPRNWARFFKEFENFFWIAGSLAFAFLDTPRRAPSAEITYLYLRACQALESHAALAQSWRIGGVERLRWGTAQQRHGAGAEAAMLPYGPLCEASRSSLSVLFGAEVAPPPYGPPYDALRSSLSSSTPKLCHRRMVPPTML